MRAGRRLVVLQIDGLAYTRVRDSFAQRALPALARWREEGNSRLIEVDGGVPSQTSSAQAVLLHGAQQPPPGFRWYDRTRRRVCVSRHPTDLRRLEAAWAPNTGLLTGGAAITTAWRAGASQWAFVLSEGIRAPNLSALSPAALRDIRLPPSFRGTSFAAWLRAVFVAQILDALTTRAVLRAIRDGRSPIFATFLGYDQVAHHAGLDAPITAWSLARIDRFLGGIEGAARRVGPVALVALSDHGLSPGAAFAKQRGASLAAVIAKLSGLGHRAWYVAASGNLAHVYARNEAAARSVDATASSLAREPGIGLALTRDGRGRGKTGSHDLERACVEGDDPVAAFGDPRRRARQLDALRRHPDAGDIIVLSEVDGKGSVAPFEEQSASHGGLGGDQTRAFALWPAGAPLACEEPVSLASLRDGLRALIGIDGRPPADAGRKKRAAFGS